MKWKAISILGLAIIAAGCTPDRDLPTGPTGKRPSFDLVGGVGGLNFEQPTYLPGNINGQDGWRKTGGFDAGVIINSSAPASFGLQSLRISNAVTSGSFGDQTFSKSLVDEAGESSAYVAIPSGSRESKFVAEWDFTSADPTGQQVGLSVVVSPDKGDGGRMSWIQLADAPSGLEVNLYDYQDLEPYGSPGTPADGRGPGGDGFVFTTVASGLDRSIAHTIRVEMELVDGPHNDVVKLYVNGSLVHTGTSWEDYFRWMQCGSCPEPTAPVGVFESRVVRSLLFRTAGTPAPGSNGKGFLIDNVMLESSSTPPDTEAPVVSNVAVTPNPAPYTTGSYALTASATDNVAVTSASYTIDGGAPEAFTFTAGSPVSLGASISPLAVGVYDICVTAEDAATNVSNTECTMLAVYDPNAGFVTGGGWIMSPEGAYVADASLTGKATFGFVSKYVKGKTLPTGNTEFQFKAGNLNFSSSAYEWLVVSGARAQYKGTGTINGSGDYRFILTAIDGALPGGGGADKFRIRIWQEGGGLVYDNLLNAPDSADPTTTLGGGNIVIHVPKK